jgi:PIN domain nuclease of toxin-antitoxin system
MRALLDTHSFLWFITGDTRLSHHAHTIIADFDNEFVLSIASLWEIGIKVSLGKLTLLRPFEEIIPAELHKHEIGILPIEFQHLIQIVTLPFHHRDPFDRLIIAQGLVEGLPIVSADPAFADYPVKVIW